MPDFAAYVRRNLPPLGLPGEREQEIVEELALEFRENYERARRGGLDPEQAWQEVRDHARPWSELGEELKSAFGEPVVEATEPVRRSSMFEDLRRDLIYAARQLRKSPGFTLIAVLMLALGIGANTAIFSLMNAILLRNLPVNHPEQLVFFGETRATGSTNFFPSGSTQAFSYSFYRQFQKVNRVFSDVAAIQSFLVESHGRAAGAADLEKLKVELVSGTYFRTLGVNAAVGRVFTAADDQTPGAHPVAVANASWSRNHLGAGETLAGKTVTIGSTLYTIIGIAPPQFFGVTVGQSPDLWIPLTMQRQICPDRYGLEDDLFRSLHVIGRLKPGVSAQQAQANTNLVFRQILRSYVGPQPSQEQLNDIRRAHIDLTPAQTGRSELRREFASPLRILMVVVVLVLLIACANVANLLLARAAARQREIALRMSLGAERRRLILQLLTESALLGVLASALGIVFAWSAGRLLVALVSAGSDLLPLRVAHDLRVLGFTAAVGIATVLLFGTAPALRGTGLVLSESLRAGRGVITAFRNRLARGLVVGQVALSVVLLIGAGLFLRSLVNVSEIQVGFDRQNVLRFRVDAATAGYQPDERLDSVLSRVEQRVASLPGIRGASFALSVFDGGGWSGDDVKVPGMPASAEKPRVDFNLVGPQYLDVMRMPVILGRGLTERDNTASRKVAVINQTMARECFPGASPVGRTFGIGDDPELQNIEVVGVVKDAKYMTLEEQQMAAAFFPHAQYPRMEYLHNLVVRYSGEPAWIVPAIRRAVAEINPNLPVGDVRLLTEMVDDFTLNRRLVAQLSSLFGVLAALLAAIGIYGVMSYGITRRTNEFGIRMALGAKRRDVLWVVLRQTLALAIAGAAVGFGLALASGRLVEDLLFGVKATNPLVMGAAVAGMIAVALLAGYIPARRATRIEPSAALRYE